MDRIGTYESSEWRRRAGLFWGIYVAFGLVSWSCTDSAQTPGSESASEASRGVGAGRAGTFLRVDAGSPSRPDAGVAAAPAAGAPAKVDSGAPPGVAAGPPPAGAAAAPAAGAPAKVDSGAPSGVAAGPPPAGAAAAPPPADAVAAPQPCTATATGVPVDIVWAIDSTASMRQEREAIQGGLNAFATALASAGIDAHMVVLSNDRDFEVPAPLGDDRARFLFVDRNVRSHDGLSVFADRFDEYAAFLRPAAALELIAVTDDESDISAIEFLSDMRARTPKEFRLNAIASERIDDDACKGAQSPGDEYYAAAALTSGVTFSICAAEDPALFEALVNGLRARVPAQCPPG